MLGTEMIGVDLDLVVVWTTFGEHEGTAEGRTIRVYVPTEEEAKELARMSGRGQVEGEFVINDVRISRGDT